jgi:hypothetical protein
MVGFPASRPAPNQEYHLLSAVRDCLSMYPYLEAVSSIRNLRTCHAVVTGDETILKKKAVALQAIEALGGEKMYSSCSFLTSAVDEGEWSASRPGRALPSGKGPPVLIG